MKWCNACWFFFILNIPVAFSQIPVWQGFEMDWTYNHRLNRLGSYIYQDSVFNTAATGTGKDSGWFNTPYILIPKPGRQYNEFHIYRRIEAKENEMIQVQIDTILPIDFHHSVFYLNGFDLVANNEADKLQLMDFGIKMVKGNYDTTYLRITYSLLFNCQSLECDWINNDVDYDLNLFIGCISFPGEDYISYVQGEMFNFSEKWDRKKNDRNTTYTGNTNAPRFITDFKFSLDKAHWYTSIHASIDAGNNVAMKFKQYREKMKQNAYYKPHANFSKRTKGGCMYEMNGITLTHPENVKRTAMEFKGSIIWKGNNKSPFSREAVRSMHIE
jgi:hypothetical protein